MSGAGKMGDRGGGRESVKSLNKSKQTKHAIEADIKRKKDQYLLARPKYSPTPQHITVAGLDASSAPMIDASCHLLSRSFNRDLIAVMRRARETGVVGCILQCDWSRVAELSVLVRQWPGQLFATIGVSAESVSDKKYNEKVFEARMDALLDLALSPEVVAFACGLDLTRDMSSHFIQSKLFAAQVQLAKQVHLPLIVSEKAASEPVCEQLALARTNDVVRTSVAAAAILAAGNPLGKPEPIVVSMPASAASFFPKVAIHNFNGTAADLERYLKNECYIMINGIVCDVKAVGDASSASSSSSSSASAASSSSKDRNVDADADEIDDEVMDVTESDGSGLNVAALVGPADLVGSGAHLYHLIRSGLLPLDRLMVASDAPLHTPQNIGDFYMRTSRNEPSNLPHIFNMLAKAYALPVSAIQEKVFATTKQFYNLLNEAEASVEDAASAEKEKQRSVTEKQIIDKEKRNEAEARKKAERETEKLEAEAEANAPVKKGQKAKDKAKGSKDDAPAAVSKSSTGAGSDDEADKKKDKKGGKKTPAPAPVKKGAAASDDDSDGGFGKQLNTKQKKEKAKAAAAKKLAAKKNDAASDDEQEEEEVVVKVLSKKEKAAEQKLAVAAAAAAATAAASAAAASKAKASKSKKAVVVSSSSEESSEEEEEIAPKKKSSKAVAAPVATKVSKKKVESSSSESDSSDEDEAPAAKSKKSAPVVAAKSKKAVVSSSSEDDSDDEEAAAAAANAKIKKRAAAKKAAAALAAESSDSDSDSDAADAKVSAETISVAKRARAAAIKATQEKVKTIRKQGDATKKKVDGDEPVDELDALFMGQSIAGLDAASAEAKRQLESKRASAASSSSADVDGDDDELVTFRCRKCQQKLFTTLDDVGHADASTTVAIGICEQIFITRPLWLPIDVIDAASSTPTGLVGLSCFKCTASIGRVSVNTPLSCACGRCGGGAAPYISVKLSRLDAVTSSSSLRGPRGFDADELDKQKDDAAANDERIRQMEKERMRQKDKQKKASLMPVTNSIGNFTQFRNKTDMRPIPLGAKKGKKVKQEEDDSD